MAKNDGKKSKEKKSTGNDKTIFPETNAGHEKPTNRNNPVPK